MIKIDFYLKLKMGRVSNRKQRKINAKKIRIKKKEKMKKKKT